MFATMVDPTRGRKIHLIGICGTGMGSLAGLLAEAGHEVRGSDESVFPPMSTMLRSKGIPILEGYKAANLNTGGRPDFVVVGNIASRDNPEVQALLGWKIEYASMPQTIGKFFLEDRHSIVVTGTHGKTTTSALIARMLMAAGLDPSFLVGGVLKDLDTSFRLGAPGGPFIIEGDEYETSFFDKGPKFLHYRPKTAVLTSVEYDHAEMFPDLDAVKEAFARFVELIPPAAAGGTLAVCADDPLALEISGKCRGEVVTYGLSPSARIRGEMIETGPDGTRFRVQENGNDLGVFRLWLTGDHNLRNALSGIAVARSLGVPLESIVTGLEAFAGVRRRQEIRGVVDNVVVVDDFAHHPTAVRETIGAIKARFRGRRVWAIFEPRTNTSRRDVFQEEYARAFDGADRIVIAPVDHPERAPEGRRFDVERLIDDLTGRSLAAETVADVDRIVKLLADELRPGDVVLVMSNGSFGRIHEKLLAALGARVTSRAAGSQPL